MMTTRASSLWLLMACGAAGSGSSQLPEAPLDRVGEEIDILALDAERRHDAEHVAVGARLAHDEPHLPGQLEQRRGLRRRRLLGAAVLHQLDRQEQAAAADIADDVMLLPQRLQDREHLAADQARILLQPFARDDAQDRPPGGA